MGRIKSGRIKSGKKSQKSIRHFDSTFHYNYLQRLSIISNVNHIIAFGTRAVEVVFVWAAVDQMHPWKEIHDMV